MMDSDDDDIYPENDPQVQERPSTEVKMEDVDDDEEEGEEVEDDDSDDEINFITDAKDAPKAEQQAKRPATISQPSISDQRKTSTPVPGIKSETTPQPQSQSQSYSQQQTLQSQRALTPNDIPSNSRPGSSYPARHTSNLDPLNANPIHPATGKPILSTDLDVDFGSGEDDKPWRKPGADLSDYFNYGFDEFTWASYCLKKQDMPKEIKGIKDDAEQMKNFLEGMGGGGGGGGMPGMPGMPGAPGQSQQTTGGPSNTGGMGQNGQQGMGGMGGMPGMPSEAEMQQMFSAMMSQGMDPSQMDQNQFMQMMMGGGGGFPSGQQPPSGPSGGFGGGFDQGGGFGGGGGGGGGGGRGRGRRGRGNW